MVKNNNRNGEEDDEYVLEDFTIQQPSSHVTLLFGGIGDKQAAEIVSWVFMNNMLETPPAELIVVINSPGGSVHSAFAMIEAFRGSAIPVRTIGMGQICSAGLLVFMSGSKGRRVLTPTCSIMSHQFSTAIGGTYHDLLNTKKELDYTQIRMLNMYTSATGKSEAYVKKYLLNPHDSWLSPEEAVKHKLADYISGTKEFI